MMTRMLVAVLSVVMFAACGDPVDEFRDAAPSAQGIDVKMQGAKSQALIGDPALMPGVTALATFAVNGRVALTLGTIAAVVASRPSQASPTEVTWGPVTRPLWRDEFMMTMTKSPQGFEYVVSGRQKTGGAFIQFLTGIHHPGLAQASGQYTVDFAAMQGLSLPPDTVGRAVVDYTRTGADVTVDIDFQQTGHPLQAERYDSRYAFSQVEGGEGAFEFVIDSNYDGATAALERLTVKSRWQWDGAGRSDVIGSGGDLSAPFRFSECWDNVLNRSYYGDTLGLFPTEGVESACAYREASFSRL